MEEENKGPGLSKFTLAGGIILAILLILIFIRETPSLAEKIQLAGNASAVTKIPEPPPKPQTLLPDPILEVLIDTEPAKITPKKTSEEIYQEASYAVEIFIGVEANHPMRINADGSATDFAIKSGSGAVVKSVQSNFYILTAEHIIKLNPGEKITSITARFKDGTPDQAMEIAGTAQKYDAALLKFKKSDFTPKACAKIGKSEFLNPGSALTGIGSCAGGEFWCSANNYLFAKPGDPGPMIRNLLKIPKWPTMMLMNISMFHGYSGGPLLNSRGELVGIMVGMFNPEGQLIGVGLPIDDILKDFKNGLIAPNP